jgi:hypothetical protein
MDLSIAASFQAEMNDPPTAVGWFCEKPNYVVEVSKDQKYRTYLYANPSHAKCSEAKGGVLIRLRVISVSSASLRFICFAPWLPQRRRGRRAAQRKTFKLGHLQAKRMLDIRGIIAEEFNLSEFKTCG